MKKIFIFLFTCMVLSSCGPTKLYSWYNYEDVTYKYHKVPDDKLREKVLIQYENMINKQREKRGVVPPGLYAEYGYMLCKMNKVSEGLEYLKKEIVLYPESEVYISRIIKSFEQ